VTGRDPSQDRVVRPASRLIRPLAGINAHVVADYGWLVGGYVGRSLAYAGLVAVLAHALGPTGFGRLSLFLAVALAIGYAAGSWPFLAIPILAAGGVRITAVIRATASIAAPACGLALAVAAAVLTASDGTVLDFVLVTIYALSFVGLQGAYALYQTLERTPLVAGYQVLERALGLAAVLALLAATQLTVTGSQAALALSAAFVCALALLHGRRLVVGRDMGLAGAAVTRRDVTAAVGPLAVITVLNYLYQWIDILILSALSAASAVGVYSLAYQGYQLTAATAALGVLALMPRFARRTAGAFGDASALLRWEALVTSAQLWSLGVGALVLCAALVYPLAFGSSYADGLPGLCLMLASCALLAPYSAVVSALQAVRQAKRIAQVTAAAVVVKLALDFALIPVAGVTGAAIATCATTTVACVALPYRVLGSRPTAQLLALSAPAVGVALALALSRSVPVLIACGLILGAWGVGVVRAPQAVPRWTGLRTR